MEVERGNGRRSVKRKPLSDRTNLIATATRLKLSSPKSSNPDSIPIPKPFNSSSKLATNSSKSDSSIGSSNYNNNAQYNSRVPKKTPANPHSAFTNSGNGDDDILEPHVVYSRRQTAEKTKSKGKVVAVPFIYPPLEKSNDKGKVGSVDFSCLPVEKTKDKREAIVVPFCFPTVEKTKDKGKGIAMPFNCLPSEKTNDNGKAKHKGKAVDVASSFPSLAKTKEKRKAVAVPLNCPHLPMTIKIWNELDKAGDIGVSRSQTDPHVKHKKKRYRVLQDQDVPKYHLPLDFIEEQRAYFKDVDDFELAEEEISDYEWAKEENN